MLVSSIIVVILLPPHPLRHRSPRPPVIWRQFGAQMRPPSDGQFWWILVGRFLFVISLFMVMQFQLYIATDEMGMTRATAGRLIAMNSQSSPSRQSSLTSSRVRGPTRSSAASPSQ